MEKVESPPDGAEVERIRNVRRSIERRFKTFDALWDHWVELDRKHRSKVLAKKKKQGNSERDSRRCAS